MPYADKKQYKNPAIPKGGGVLPSTQKALRAPIRGPGFMQMDAAATARQPKFGSPDIPVTGQADYKRQAAQQMAMGAAATAEPATRAKAAEGMMSRSVAGAPPITTPALTVPIAFTAAQPAAAPTEAQPVTAPTPVTDVTATPEGVTEAKPAYDPSTGYLTDMKAGEVADAHKEAYDEAIGQGYSEEQAQAAGAFAAAQVESKTAGMTKKEGSETLYTDDEGNVWYSGEKDFLEGKDPEKLEKSYDDEGNWNGYITAGGQYVDKQGKPMESGDVGGATGLGEHPKQEKIQFREWAFEHIMGDKWGVTDEELDGMIQNIENASVDQMHRMAQTLASRGMGASGLVNVGMGDIWSEAMTAITTLQAEVKKFNAEQFSKKMDTIAALYGSILSDENRIAVARIGEDAKKREFDARMEADDLQSMSALKANVNTDFGGKGMTMEAQNKLWAFYADNKDEMSLDEIWAKASAQLYEGEDGKVHWKEAVEPGAQPWKESDEDYDDWDSYMSYAWSPSGQQVFDLDADPGSDYIATFVGSSVNKFINEMADAGITVTKQQAIEFMKEWLVNEKGWSSEKVASINWSAVIAG